MIDSHCHLADEQFNEDLDATITRAVEAGVERLITIADSLKEGEKCLKIAEKYDHIFCTIGVHPHNAKDWNPQSGATLVEMLSSSKKAVAVGEIGLDYHYDNSPRDVQRDAFYQQLSIAKELRLPSVVHNRESISDLKQIISEVEPDSLVIHCCTEKWSDVAELVERGFFLSFTGIATYPKAEEIRETIKQCPLSQIMIETDAPYLAPVPYRGKRNEPAYVVEVAKLIAEIKGVSLQEVDEVTAKNAVAFFTLPDSQ